MILAGSLGASALVGCRSSTQLTIEVTTELPCTVKSAGIAVGVLGAALEDAPPATVSGTCDANGRIGALVVIPSGANDGPIALKVVGGVDGDADTCTDANGYAGCIVARRALRFVPHENLRIEVPLRASCKNVPCDASATCVRGACVSAVIPSPETCSGTACDEGTLGGPAGGGDAGVEAGSSEAGVVEAGVSEAGTGCSGATCGGPLALGSAHSCALATDKTVRCWGIASSGQLGAGPQSNGGPPTTVKSASFAALASVRALSAGVGRTCAFLEDGSVSCWGDQAGGAALTTEVDYATPVSILNHAVDVALGKTHACFRTDALSLFCVGDGTENALGTADTSASTPVKPEIVGPFALIASSDNFSCVVKADGTLWCFGANGAGTCDPGGPSPTFPPKKLDLPFTFTDVKLGVASTCALTSDGRVMCWGDNEWSQSGVDARDGGLSLTPPVFVTGPDGKTALTGAVQLALGYYHACARMSDGSVSCWGADASGNLGRGNAIDPNGQSPFADSVVDDTKAKLTGATYIAAGGDHTCVVKAAGEVWCWGSDVDGESGQQDGVNRAFATRVAF